MKTVVCFGEALIDMLSNKSADTQQSTETFTKFAGGAPANVAGAIAKMEIPSAFCGMLGDDMFGHFLFEEFQRIGVDTQFIRFTDKAKTALAFVSLDSDGERHFEFYRPPAADLLFTQHDFEPDMFANTAVFHICSNSLTDSDIASTTLHGLTQARAHGALVSFDVNLRLNLWSDTTALKARVEACLALAHVVKMSREEAVHLTEEANVEAYIEELVTQHHGVVLLTDADQPIKVYTEAGSFTVTPPVVKAIDTTAAGDAFSAGFLYQLTQMDITTSSFLEFTRSDMLKYAVKFASHCGAHAVTRAGAFPSLPTKQDADAFAIKLDQEQNH